MKAAICALAILAATPALADPGHFAEERGHNHWLALGALALAFVIAGAVLWRERRARRVRKAAEKKA